MGKPSWNLLRAKLKTRGSFVKKKLRNELENLWPDHEIRIPLTDVGRGPKLRQKKLDSPHVF